MSRNHTTDPNLTDITLVREDSDGSDIFIKRRQSIHRRNSLMMDDSFKKLPLDPNESFKKLPTNTGSSFKKLPLDPNDSFRKLPGQESSDSYKKLPTAEETSHKRLPRRNSILDNVDLNESFKRLPSTLTRRNSILDEPKPSSSKNEDVRASITMVKRPTVKEIANTSGSDLLRLSQATRRNSTTSDDELRKPSISRKNSVLGGLLKAMRWTEESDSEKARRSVKTWDQFDEIYKRGPPIGQGTQGQVIRGHRLSDDLAVVIKIVEEHSVKPWNLVGKMPVSAYLLRALNFPEEGRENILFCKYIAHFHIEKHWVLVTEYEEHEWIDLSDLLLQNKKPLPEGEILKIFHGIVHAVCDLHSIGFTHNDIKENNVLVHRETKAIKLIDLDSCREITPETVSPTEFAGTICYASPEIKTCNFFSPESQDIYALGTLLLSMFFIGEIPGIDMEKDVLDSHTISKIFREERPAVSSFTIKLVQAMLAKKSSKRPLITDLIPVVDSLIE